MPCRPRSVRKASVIATLGPKPNPLATFCGASLSTEIMRHARSRKWLRGDMAGSYAREPKQWGEIVIADHLVSRSDNWAGVRNYKNAVNIKDLYSGLIASVPVRNKGHEEARKAFTWFCGSRRVLRIYSDNSGELKVAAE